MDRMCPRKKVKMTDYLALSLMLTLAIEPTMAIPVEVYNLDPVGNSSQGQSHDRFRNALTSSSESLQDTVDTGVTRTLAAIVQFETFLAEEKANLLSSSLHFGDNQERIHSRLDDNSNTLSECLLHINNVIDAAEKGLPWALKMIDASGKPSSGILEGNNVFTGNFDQCIDVDSGLGFKGQYCSATVWMETGNTTENPGLRFMQGFCFPSSCDAQEVENYINSYFRSNPDITAVAQQTNCQERHLHLSTKAKWVISICSIFVTIVVLSTFYDVVYKRWWLEKEKRQNTSHDQSNYGENGSARFNSDKSLSEHDPIIDPKSQQPKLYSNNETAPKDKPSTYYEICDKFLMSFSVYTNTAVLFTVKQSQGSIDCIFGMRFISMTWIILYHVYAYGAGKIDNARGLLDMTHDEWTFMPINKSVNAVDTFFAIGGLLVTFLTLKKLTKEGVTPRFFGMFYLHRFLRLTPPYMLILMTYVPLYKYISDGPFWPQDGLDVDECKDTWWLNLLYLNNFIKEDKMCMGWSWYLANDMQFFVVSPLMILPLFFFDWKGLIAPFAFLLGTAICSGVISNAKDILAVVGLNVLGGDIGPQVNDYYKYYYNKPYCRIGPFVIGVITGYILFKTECKPRLSKLAVALGWIAATAIALAVVYGPYDHVRYEDRQSKEVRALYNALQSIAWGVSVCWVVFACATGYGGFVNTLLSWKPLIPLGRLTYCNYLIQPLVLDFYFLSQRTPIYANNLNFVVAFLGILTICYGVAYIAYMIYEVPMTGLEKILISPRKRK